MQNEGKNYLELQAAQKSDGVPTQSAKAASFSTRKKVLY